MSLEKARLAGSYELIRQVGSGGTGTIYLAQDLHQQRRVALKVIPLAADLHHNELATAKISSLFQQATRALTLLEHPHVAPLLAFGQLELEGTTSFYTVTDFYPAASLADWLTQTSRLLTLAEIAELLTQLASALHHAHERGVLHQDLKPSNILLRTPFRPPAPFPVLQLADFGIAHLFAATSSTGLSQSPYLRGASLFLAPEQWNGQALPASDQYALAVLAFYLLTGAFPFKGSLSQLMLQHQQAQPPAPSSIKPQLPTSVDALLARALAKQPEQRFPSVLDFAQAFASILPVSTDAPSLLVRNGAAPESASEATLLPAKDAALLPEPAAITPGTNGTASLSTQPEQPPSLANSSAPVTQLAYPETLPTEQASEATLAVFPASGVQTECPQNGSRQILADNDADKTAIQPRQGTPLPDQLPLAIGVEEPAEQSVPAPLLVAAPLESAPETPLSEEEPTLPVASEEAAAAKVPAEPTPIENGMTEADTIRPAQAEKPESEWMRMGSSGEAARVNGSAERPRTGLPDGSSLFTPTVLPSAAASLEAAGASLPQPMRSRHPAPPPPAFVTAPTRRAFSPLQKSLLVALIAAIVLFASGVVLFKDLANGGGAGVPGSSNRANGIVIINITPTSTSNSSNGNGVPGVTGTASGAGSNGGNSGSTSSTGSNSGTGSGSGAQPTPTSGSSSHSQPTPTPTPKPKPTPTPTPTPTPHPCDIHYWTATLSPVYFAGGTALYVSSYCNKTVYLTLTAAPASNGHEVDLQICYGLRTLNCSGWVKYSGVNVWLKVASGLKVGQVFYINGRCTACTGSSFKVSGAAKY